MPIYTYESKTCLRVRTKVLRVLLIILITGIFVSGLTHQTQPQIYIALGDSVSSGFGLPGYKSSPQGKHTSFFFEKLKNEGFVDEYHNMAVSGFTTSTLLKMLNNLGSDELELFRNAHVITLNIGGNNLIEPLVAYMSDTELLAVVENIRRATMFGDILFGLNRLREIITGFPDDLSTILLPEFETRLEEALDIFSQELEEIITWLQLNSPNAIIIANTVYNPIPQEILGLSVIPVINWTNKYIVALNHRMIEESRKRGFLVTDTHPYLSNRPDLIHFNLNPFIGPLSIDIIHPNAQGHSLIAELNYATFVQR